MGQGIDMSFLSKAVNGPQQQLAIASPFNDVQLVAMIAAHVDADSAEEAVAQATEIVAEAVVQAAKLPALVARKRRAQAEGN